jgi:RNA polymerase sigma factor (sigma-70 family)
VDAADHVDCAERTLTPEELLTSQYELIERVIAFTARRYHLNDTDAQEFHSHVLLKLVEDDYQVFKKWRRQSNLRTYLTSVIQHQCLDFRTAQWGKWRPSAEARRLGPLAIDLERLITRDGFTFDQACEILRTNHRVEATEAELEEIFTRLPMRTPRKWVDDSELATIPSNGVSAESAMVQAEAGEVRTRLLTALKRVLATLEPQERLMLEWRFWHDMTVANISRALQFEQPKLYPKLRQLFAELRAQLEAEGFAAGDIDSLFAGADVTEADEDGQE